jgi:hypothetical protein
MQVHTSDCLDYCLLLFVAILITLLRYISIATTTMQLVTKNGLLMAVGCAHTFMTVNDLLNALRTAAASCGKRLTVVQQHTGSRQLKNNDAPIEDDTTTSNSLLTATKLQEISTTAIADADSSSGGDKHTSTFQQLSQQSISSSSDANSSSSTTSSDNLVNQQVKLDAISSVSQDAVSALERTQLLHAMAPHWLLVRCANANIESTS